MVRYLHPADHNSARIRKVIKLYGDNLDFKDLKFPVKVEKKLKKKLTKIHKIEKKFHRHLYFRLRKEE